MEKIKIMRKSLLLTLIALALVFSRCKNDDTSSISKFSVRITDAPGAYQSLLLNIKEIQVLSSEGTSVLPVDSKPFDILRYRNGKDTLLASEYIPAGRLQEIRLILNETGNSVVIDDVQHDLTVPSAVSSGIKLKVNADLSANIGYTLLLDFDAARSIVKAGNNKYILKPVIRAIPEAISGAIKGSITPASANPKLYAISGTDTIGTITDSIGNFYFPGLRAGTYKVEIKPEKNFNIFSINNVSVVNGSVTDLGVTDLAATE